MNPWLLVFSFFGFALFEGRRIIDDYSKDGSAAQLFRSQSWYWVCIAFSAIAVSVISALLSTSNLNDKIWPFMINSPTMIECVRSIIFGYCAIPVLKSKNIKSASEFGIDDMPAYFSGKFRWWLNR